MYCECAGINRAPVLRRKGSAALSTAGLVLATALALTGCSGENSEPQSDAKATSGSGTGGHDGKQPMNMGDPSATPAADIPDAEVRKGEFVLLDTRPPQMDDVEGTAWLAQHEKGTTVTLSMRGLDPDADYISHLHVNPCSEENGGPHFRFDPDGPGTPPNEVHLAFTSDAKGKGTMTVNNDRRTGKGAASLVVHPQLALDNRIACVDF